MSWTRVKVGCIAEQIRGVTYDKAEASKTPADGLMPILRANNITEAGLTFADLVYVPARRISPKQLLRPGDIVIAASSGSIEVVGKAARLRAPFEGSFGAFCKVLRPRNDVDAGYFSHFFQTSGYRRRISALAAGANINNLKNEHLDELEIPLPPLNEQRRIAAILDQAEELRAKRRAAIALLDQLPQAIFLEMFGDPIENPKRLPLRSVSDFVLEFQGGKSLESEVGKNITSRNRVLKISAVTGMTFVADQSKPVPDSYIPPDDHFVRDGDLLFSRANTSELVGAVALVRTPPPNLLLPDKLWRFVWRNPEALEPLFVWTLFQTPAMRHEIAKRATGTSGSMKNISKAKLVGIRTILPHIELQREFARQLTAVQAIREAHLVSLADHDSLFYSLQTKAFAGALMHEQELTHV